MADHWPRRAATRRGGRRSLAALGLALTTACYSYVAVAPEAAAPGAQVRVLVNGGPAAAPRAITAARTDIVEGMVLERGEEALLLSIIPRDLGVQSWSHGPRDTVAIRWGELEVLEEKRLSRARTAGAVAGATVAGVVALRYLFGSWSGATTRPGGGGPAEARLPR